MDDDVVISVDHVSKKFRVYIDKGSQLKEKMLFRERNRYEDRPVLKDISFEVRKGEAIGLVGHNGCGKSTTLKLLTRIMYPDTGKITMKGRVVALIELGAGFHPDMSGRENIYINAAIFGLSKKEIDEKIDDIIAFSELDEFIDNPVRTYSSGMYTRLAFSVAINVDADILLIDEILAVGDAGFQAKCFDRLKRIKASGATIVIVSHSLNQIEEICDRSYWIHEGLVKTYGAPKEVHEQYMDYIDDYRQKIAAKEVKRLEEKRLAEESKENTDKKAEEKQAAPTIEEILEQRKGDGNVKFKRIMMYNSENVAQTIFKTGDSARIEIDYEVAEGTIQNPEVAIGIMRLDGVLMYLTSNLIDGVTLKPLSGSGTLTIEIPSLNLLQAGYNIDLSIAQEGKICVYYSCAICIEVISKSSDAGTIRIEHNWKQE